MSGAELGDAYDRRRSRGPRSGDSQRAESIETLETVSRPAQRFGSWDDIIGVVQEEMNSRGYQAGGDFSETIDETAFFNMVGAAVELHPAWGVSPAQVPDLVSLLREEFFGFGPLAPYMNLEGLEEILCNRHDRVFIILEGIKRRLDPSPFASEKEVRDFLNRVFAAQGRELNISNPAEDGHLPDGSRIHAEVPPLSVLGSCFAIRKFRPRPFTMEQYLETDMFTPEFLTALRTWIGAQFNIVISGGTGSGKTTFINAVGSLLPADDRLLIIENTKELQIETDDTIYLQSIMRGAREGRQDGMAITIRDALRYALRMRPDRIIVGEVRSHEAFDLLQALNTGHDGSLTTIHANSAQDAISRLESLAIGADELPLEPIQDLIARTVDVIIEVGRFRGTPYRKVLEAYQVIHPQKVTDDARPRLKALRDAGDLIPLRGPIYMVPLFTITPDGTLVYRNDALPVIGKKPLQAVPLPAERTAAPEPITAQDGPTTADAVPTAPAVDPDPPTAPITAPLADATPPTVGPPPEPTPADHTPSDPSDTPTDRRGAPLGPPPALADATDPESPTAAEGGAATPAESPDPATASPPAPAAPPAPDLVTAPPEPPAPLMPPPPAEHVSPPAPAAPPHPDSTPPPPPAPPMPPPPAEHVSAPAPAAPPHPDSTPPPPPADNATPVDAPPPAGMAMHAAPAPDARGADDQGGAMIISLLIEPTYLDATQQGAWQGVVADHTRLAEALFSSIGATREEGAAEAVIAHVPDAQQALAAAVALQRECAAAEDEEPVRTQPAITIITGPGRTERSGRVGVAAHPGQILIAGPTPALPEGVSLNEVGVFLFGPDEETLHQVRADGLAHAFPPPRGAQAVAAPTGAAPDAPKSRKWRKRNT